jgi:glycosyltransferase involved in cell wall biosynthesis
MMRVGFGVTALCKGIAGGGSDGIGNYTLEMLRQFGVRDDLSLVPFAFGQTVACEVLRELDRAAPSAPSEQTEIDGESGLSSNRNLGAPALETKRSAADSSDRSGITLGRYPLNAAWSAATSLNFFGINHLNQKVDLIHATDHYVPKCAPVPLVATLMDAIPLSHPHWSRGNHRGLKNALWVRAANWADQIITISEYSKLELAKWTGISLNKISVIPLGVDKRWFREVPAAEFAQVRARYALPERFFISVGTLQPRKNIEGAILAHRSMPLAERQRVPLVIVGRAGWKCEAVLKMIDEDTSSGAVRWLQHVPEADLLTVVKSASALVFASLAEGFGLPVLEAFAAQVPVVTSNTTSLPEVTGDAALTVNPLDIAALSAAMTRVIGDEALANDLKQRGLLRAQSFNWQACAAATVGVYQEVLAR